MLPITKGVQNFKCTQWAAFVTRSIHLIYFQVASLSWLERKFASSLIAAPPEGSYDQAMSQFAKAEELSSKEWKENRLFLAKCCAQLGQMADCLSWLDKAAAAPIVSPEVNTSKTHFH
jgi:hypothetical protein